MPFETIYVKRIFTTKQNNLLATLPIGLKRRFITTILVQLRPLPRSCVLVSGIEQAVKFI